MSTGLAYRNARQAPSAEVAALVRAVSEAGGIYTTHLRDEFAGQAEAMDEAFATAAEARLAWSSLPDDGSFDGFGGSDVGTDGTDKGERTDADGSGGLGGGGLGGGLGCDGGARGGGALNHQVTGGNDPGSLPGRSFA